MHEAVDDAIARHDAEGARATMQHLLSESHEFMNRHIHALPRPNRRIRNNLILCSSCKLCYTA
jgi:DNA-binding GntR family transcriptional regulator